MKRFFIICLAVLMLLPTSVYAEDTVTWSHPYAYAEKENGLYVRTISEEVEGCPEELWYQEITAVKMARMQDELTDEMKEAGYFLQSFRLPDSGEIAYYPSEPPSLESDSMSKSAYYKKAMKERADEIPSEFGYLYVKANTSEKIKETESDICLIIEGVDVLGYYEFNLLAINDYELSTTLPVGSYNVLQAGVKNDYKSEYPVNYDSELIEMKEAGAILFTFDVGESVYKSKNIEIKQKDGLEDPIDDFLIMKDESNHKFLYTILAYIIVVIVLFLVCYEIYKKRNSEV